MARRPPDLVLRKIQIRIRCNRHTIRPPNPRISHKNTEQTSGSIENINSILFEITEIDEPVAVRLQAVRDPFLAVGDDGCLGENLGERGVVPQASAGNAVQGA